MGIKTSDDGNGNGNGNGKCYTDMRKMGIKTESCRLLDCIAVSSDNVIAKTRIIPHAKQWKSVVARQVC